MKVKILKVKDNALIDAQILDSKYNAFQFGETTMVIPPVGGEKLINEFLNN